MSKRRDFSTEEISSIISLDKAEKDIIDIARIIDATERTVQLWTKQLCDGKGTATLQGPEH